ncbi:UNVERIFIED_CONTAM: putative mitochondrial protein [Sesamum latifolium]|uniref:Mitochondrial protein n=1 Tax=Sesamum latifolium TaxID=2727402 RepID=A0AAW2Y7C6_9LAMI
MKQELMALERNETRDIVLLPNGKRAIGCKWVFKIKLKDNGSVDRYKARLVAKEIYMTDPEGYEVAPGYVCKLKCSDGNRTGLGRVCPNPKPPRPTNTPTPTPTPTRPDPSP